MAKSAYTNYEKGLIEEAIDYGISSEDLDAASIQDLELYTTIEEMFRDKYEKYPDFFNQSREASALNPLLDSILASPASNNPEITVKEALIPLYMDLIGDYEWTPGDFYNRSFPNRYAAPMDIHRNINYDEDSEYIPRHKFLRDIRQEGADIESIRNEYLKSIASTTLSNLDNMHFRTFPHQDLGPYWDDYFLGGMYSTGIHEDPDTISIVSEEDINRIAKGPASTHVKLGLNPYEYLGEATATDDKKVWEDKWNDIISKDALLEILFHEIFHGTGIKHTEGHEQGEFSDIFQSDEFSDIFSEEDKELIWNAVFPGPTIPEIPYEQRELY